MNEIIQKNTFEVIKSAVNKMVDFIKPTYGPANNKIIISKTPYFMVVDDGVQAARDYELTDPAENAVVKLIREVAVKTNDRVGDGTTSSLIMLQAIINEIDKYPYKNGKAFSAELKEGAEEVKEKLTKIAQKISTKEELKKVARISFDDEKISEMIAELYYKLGKDAVITVDRSSGMDIECDISNGIKLNKGYISPYMITNPERMEGVLEKPYILITDYRITEAADILPIMEKMVQANKRELVIICENIEQSALSTLIVNKMQGKFMSIAVNTSTNDKVLLEDIAKLTGGKLFSEGKGDKLETVEISDLGRAERFISKKDESVIVNPKGDKKDITKAISLLKMALQLDQKESDKQDLKKRLGLYTNSIAVIKVGAPTENEQKALKYKIEDAVNSVKVAYNSGVVCGAGLSLARVKTSSDILNKALQYPARQLMKNMNLNEQDIPEKDALNVITSKYGKPMEIGVIDPVDVLIAGVESAVSIATMLITSSGMIVEVPKKEE